MTAQRDCSVGINNFTSFFHRSKATEKYLCILLDPLCSQVQSNKCCVTVTLSEVGQRLPIHRARRRRQFVAFFQEMRGNGVRLVN